MWPTSATLLSGSRGAYCFRRISFVVDSAPPRLKDDAPSYMSPLNPMFSRFLAADCFCSASEVLPVDAVGPLKMRECKHMLPGGYTHGYCIFIDCTEYCT
jgi:hypothetical protein